MILVDDAHPPAAHGDHLKGDAMKVDPVGYRTAFADGNVRSDVAAVQAAWDEVAVEHPRPALARIGACAGQHEFRNEAGQSDRWLRRAGLRRETHPLGS